MIIKEFICKCHGQPIKRESYGDEYFYFCQANKMELSDQDFIENLRPTISELLNYLEAGHENERTVDAVVGVGDAPEQTNS